MLPSCGRLRRYLLSSGLRFDQPEMEAQFRTAEGQFTVSLAHFWIGLTGLFLAVGLPFQCHRYGWFQNPDFAFLVHFAPFAILTLLFAVIRTRCLQAHAYRLLCGTCFTMVCWTAISVYLLIGEEIAITNHAVLAEVFAALEHDVNASSALQSYLGDEVSQKYLWYALAANFLHLDLLMFLGTTCLSLLVFCCVPLSLWIVMVVSPATQGSIWQGLIMTVLLILYSLGLSAYMALTRRRQFQLGHQLQCTLENEAAALKEAADQEAAMKEASQEADTILNHLLKNVMADAAGCIHLYLRSLPPALLSAPPTDLVQATECLERGVAWCRKRQALLRIASGQYTPQLCDVDLARFGHSLLQGRSIGAEFPDEVVVLDPLLCEIVLENALTNAHRHGHPSEPDLRFTASLTLLPGDTNPMCCRHRLTFTVINRTHPSRPPLTPELVTSLLRGEELPLGHTTPRLSEHLGMQHLCHAARTHDMEINLTQVGDRVYFEACLEVTVRPFISPSLTLAKEGPSAVPPNLRMFCIDDSSVARRLLVHVFSREPMNATVTAFGQTAEEVTEFLEQAVVSADIVILDYYLDYGRVSYLGTDLLRSLLERGFQGLVCMRSANASPFDEAVYTRAGAHCCIGKDVHPQAMVAALMAAYLRWQAQMEASQSPLPLFSMTARNRAVWLDSERPRRVGRPATTPVASQLLFPKSAMREASTPLLGPQQWE